MCIVRGSPSLRIRQHCSATARKRLVILPALFESPDLKRSGHKQLGSFEKRYWNHTERLRRNPGAGKRALPPKPLPFNARGYSATNWALTKNFHKQASLDCTKHAKLHLAHGHLNPPMARRIVESQRRTTQRLGEGHSPVLHPYACLQGSEQGIALMKEYKGARDRGRA